MSDTLLIALHEKAKMAFGFLEHYGYTLQDSDLEDNEVSKLVFTNKETSKEINVSTCNYDDVERFFLNISIVRSPYLVVNDFLSFDAFVKKQGLIAPPTLEKNDRTIDNATNYINKYANLFKQYGTELFTSGKQNPGYFPEWT